MNYKKIIDTLKKYTNQNEDYFELGEQEAATTSAYPTVTKWETGLNRSVANQIDDKIKWKDLYKLTRGKANTLL